MIGPCLIRPRTLRPRCPQNFRHCTPGVPAAFKRRVQPELDHVVHEVLAQQVGGEAEDIGVVVAAAHFGRDVVVAGGRADAGELVRRHAHPQAGAADQNAALGLAAADHAGDPCGHVGIVDGLAGIGAHVFHLVLQAAQQIDDPARMGKPR